MFMSFIIVALLLIGLALIVIEVIFIPGTTVVGLIGLVFSIVGIVISYKHFGSEVGFYILLGVSATTAVALFYSFRSGMWSKFSLNSSSNSRVNEGLMASLKVGDEGKAISTLKPMGKVEFESGQFEVKTLGDYVDVGTKVKIVHIQSNQIIVKPLN
jgi:membrane-bound ClpP family serine protease